MSKTTLGLIITLSLMVGVIWIYYLSNINNRLSLKKRKEAYPYIVQSNYKEAIKILSSIPISHITLWGIVGLSFSYLKEKKLKEAYKISRYYTSFLEENLSRQEKKYMKTAELISYRVLFTQTDLLKHVSENKKNYVNKLNEGVYQNIIKVHNGSSILIGNINHLTIEDIGLLLPK